MSPVWSAELCSNHGDYMGSSSKTSSQATSSEESNSRNVTTTQSVGAGSLGVMGNIGGNATYQSNSNNPITTTNLSAALGANSNASGSPSSGFNGSPAGTDSGLGIDWNEIIVYVIAGVVLVFVLRFLKIKGGS